MDLCSTISHKKANINLILYVRNIFDTNAVQFEFFLFTWTTISTPFFRQFLYSSSNAWVHYQFAKIYSPLKFGIQIHGINIVCQMHSINKCVFKNMVNIILSECIGWMYGICKCNKWYNIHIIKCYGYGVVTVTATVAVAVNVNECKRLTRSHVQYSPCVATRSSSLTWDLHTISLNNSKDLCNSHSVLIYRIYMN